MRAAVAAMNSLRESVTGFPLRLNSEVALAEHRFCGDVSGIQSKLREGARDLLSESNGARGWALVLGEDKRIGDRSTQSAVRAILKTNRKHRDWGSVS
jgi:hypothetical protein